jgi:formate-dependent nitrite reductase cytochrome c552 subunit
MEFARMRKITGAVLAHLLVATSAQAGPPFACCVCEGPESALFCTAIPSDDTSAFETECTERGGESAPCSAAGSPDDCTGVFTSADCPNEAPVGAPVAGPGSIIALAALLAGFGAVALRSGRRRSRAL